MNPANPITARPDATCRATKTVPYSRCTCTYIPRDVRDVQDILVAESVYTTVDQSYMKFQPGFFPVCSLYMPHQTQRLIISPVEVSNTLPVYATTQGSIDVIVVIPYRRLSRQELGHKIRVSQMAASGTTIYLMLYLADAPQHAHLQTCDEPPQMRQEGLYLHQFPYSSVSIPIFLE